MVDSSKKGLGKDMKTTVANIAKAPVNLAKVPVNGVLGTKRDFGQKAADNLAKWAGSWTFIIGFLVFLGLWMATNAYAWLNEWDPYPFILLNLVLSCIAALQAPVILMSQNRQAEKDRQKAEYDYAVNRKTERKVEEMIKQLNRIDRRLRS